MGTQVTIGGERLGSGKKMKAYMHNYERSTHDLSYVWKSTMSAGTLVPFMSEVALPGDTFDINLDVDVMTHPTIGPLFGSYKVQLDIFQVPIRLYQAQLHMNALNIGRDMSKIKLPQLYLSANKLTNQKNVDNQQINPSCILSYFGIRGLGFSEETASRAFNAVPWIGYWDIYKNYYANKQEEIGAVIHKRFAQDYPNITNATFINTLDGDITVSTGGIAWENVNVRDNGTYLVINVSSVPEGFDPDTQLFLTIRQINGQAQKVAIGVLFDEIIYDDNNGLITCTGFWGYSNPFQVGEISYIVNWSPDVTTSPLIETFPLENIDKMREELLKWFSTSPLYIGDSGSTTDFSPYNLIHDWISIEGETTYSKQYSQEGLAIKTYQSDLFNNWISTEWIDGPDGISEVTAIDTSGGSFTLDELNLSQKIYNMLNRIALSGGTYDDWLDAVYTHDRQKSAENPIYLGGAIRELVFQEVVSTATTNVNDQKQALGSLAGKGILNSKRKGGKVIAKIDEPSYIIGIVSLTPRIVYSQGNKWDVNLDNLNDLHKPALDEIGFQDLITDQMAFWETWCEPLSKPEFKSAGKQPAWINYMTNVNRSYGNFAIVDNQMFMTLNRKYEYVYDPDEKRMKIKDLTTYIDPAKFNEIFADNSLDGQNFWVQIACDIEARRKMSAKVIPNL